MKSYTERRVKRLIKIYKNQLSQYDLTGEPWNRYNYHGGRMIGYIQGRLEVYEDILDEPQVIKEITND